MRTHRRIAVLTAFTPPVILDGTGLWNMNLLIVRWTKLGWSYA